MTERPAAVIFLLALAACSFGSGADVARRDVPAVHDLTVPALDGEPVALAAFRGDVLLVVNVASECGFTGQYAGLQALHEELAPRGLRVLGFPSDDFGGQEPGTAAEIRAFCDSRFGVTFPLFAKVVTRAGPEQSALYARLGALSGKLPSWNFGKYVVGRDGRRVEFFGTRVGPDDPRLRAAIERELGSR